MFGMPSLIECDTIRDTVGLCRELGLSFLELNANFPNHQPQFLNAAELQKLAASAGIFYTVHLNDELYVAEFNPRVAQGYCDSVLDTIDFAKKIGAPILNMHLSTGAYYTMPDRRIRFYEAYQGRYFDGLARFRDLCTEAIGDENIRICVENTDGYLPFQQKALELLLESPVFGLTLDIGHNRCSGSSDESFILDCADRLQHLHLHDVLGHKDHLPLGTGELDLKPYLELAKDRTAVIEVKTVEGLRKSVAWVGK